MFKHVGQPNHFSVVTKGGKAGAALLCLLGATQASRAQPQQVLAPLPQTPIFSPALQTELESHAGFIAPTAPAIVPSDWNLLKWGPVTARPHLDYQFSYGNGLQSTPGNRQSSVVQTISPGILLELGTRWMLDYTPSLNYYSSKQFRDNVGQSVSLSGNTAYENWVFGLVQSYSDVIAPLVQTGAQTETEAFVTALNASYRFNSAFSTDLSASQSFSSAVGLQNSHTWTTMDYLNYQFWERLTVGVGAGFTYDQVSIGPDMTSEQVQVRINWRAADKLSISLHGGIEDRQFMSGGQPSLFSPVFGAAVTYQLADYTTLSLSADRSISPSVLVSPPQVTTTTSLNLGLSQRLLKDFNLSVNGGYNNSEYQMTTVGPAVNRSDSYYSLNVRLSWIFLKRASASIFYQYSVNNSSQGSNFAFTSNQSGFQLGYRF